LQGFNPLLAKQCKNAHIDIIRQGINCNVYYQVLNTKTSSMEEQNKIIYLIILSFDKKFNYSKKTTNLMGFQNHKKFK
jgi:hypothetical protein